MRNRTGLSPEFGYNNNNNKDTAMPRRMRIIAIMNQRLGGLILMAKCTKVIAD